MKLLFPIFASLMLQWQVNTEYFGLRRCVMGLGRCKEHCNMDEKELDKCKKKKCCIRSKVVQLIKNYIQNEMLHMLKEDSQEVLKITKNVSVMMQTKHHNLSVLPKIKSANAFANVNTIIIPNATIVNSATTNPVDSGKIIHTATSTKKRRDSGTDSPPPAPPPSYTLPTA
ncbi:beta-defensin 129 [Budorcas taxicolor]|uniref:beta-defensin 129 n=1 Tax=Budorcas taxicolor TaxID=37181 RepID=UPI002283F6C3|nr:beta-defensin 129 [Budorcas taxicolor]